MICPNCRATLLRKERPDSVCGKCGRPFALDPKVHGRGMHDTRIRRVVDKATDGGRRNVTVTQLWYLARTGNPRRGPGPDTSLSSRAAHSIGTTLLVALVLLGFVVHGRSFAVLLLSVGTAVSALVYGAALSTRNAPVPRAHAHVLPTQASFRSMICKRWVQVYGSLPPGIVDDREGRQPPPYKPRPGTVELLCPDPAVRVFLAANDLPARLDLALAAGLGEFSGDGPVVVLHDAGVRGLQMVADVRAHRPPRVVVDAGLPLRAVVGNEKAVLLHEDPPESLREEQPEWLRRLAREAPDHAEWLLQGWFSPLAAVPPAVLESAVERAVREARAAPAPELREAAAAGFMSWLHSPEPAVEDGS
ncbi:hypothetical protein OG539_04845 [Actinacidiphila glaucinigra]|uniref:hypothetical protein n=1 Tax=Actinacidiphila glaucinigra TaxID=235986 RepID=UPI0032562DEC